MPDQQDSRAALSDRLWKIAKEFIEAEWICCEPVEPRHELCQRGNAALGMARALLVDADPAKAWNPKAPLLDAVINEIRRTLMQALPTDDFGQPIRQCHNCDDVMCFGCAQRPEAEQKMLDHALGLAQEEIFSRGNEFSAEDEAALANLKRSVGSDRRTKELEATLLRARNALAMLIEHAEDPGTAALDALYLASRATSGLGPDAPAMTTQLLAERDARIIEAVAKAIGDDSWSRRDQWGRYEEEEVESGMRKAEALAEELAEKVRAGMRLTDSE